MKIKDFSNHDFVGTYEGLCAASVAIMYPQVVDRSAFQRNISFSVKRGVSATQESKLRPCEYIQLCTEILSAYQAICWVYSMIYGKKF